jgi:hypothetical protein
MAKPRGISYSHHNRRRILLRIAFAVLAPLAAAQNPELNAPQTPPQNVDTPPAQQSGPVKQRFLVSKFPDKPSIPPTWTIPIEPLGYTAPGAIYLGARNSLASLDFLDEDHLLFTFRVPGLIHRDFANGQESEERQIRAIVLTLPLGAVEADALWTVHDRTRYLWTLKDGHFLLRDRNDLLEGDASLKLKPVLDFPGSILWLELDPQQQFMVTNSREPATSAKPDSSKSSSGGLSSAASNPAQVDNPSSASATVTTDDDESGRTPDLVVRILRRESGQVLLVSRVRSAIHLPINSKGYVENLRGRASEWVLNLSYFTGGSRMLGSVISTCSPTDDFLSEDEIFVTGCGPMGETKLMAVTTTGRTLWASQAPSTEIWPQLVVANNGLRMAWETLDSTRSVNSYAPLGAEDIKEQSVTVFDAANGDIALVSPVSPVLDSGGNVAISPSARRVALLNAGAIQVFELPAPPGLPVATGKRQERER